MDVGRPRDADEELCRSAPWVPQVDYFYSHQPHLDGHVAFAVWGFALCGAVKIVLRLSQRPRGLLPPAARR
eukprot:5166460-Prymnesium_polylepis.2